MTFKTVFTPVAQPGEHTELAYAAGLCEAWDAHLDVLCLGVDRAPTTFYEIGSNAVIMHAAIEEAHARADEIRAQVDQRLKRSNVRWDAVKSVSSSAAIGRTVASRSRYADLAVVAMPYAEGSAPETTYLLESLLFETDNPVIVVPRKPAAARPSRISIGWNESTEAMRAIRAALPFLQAAETVHIAVIDPSENGPERSDPGGALAVYLSRHGVHSDIQVMTRQGMTVSQRLARHVMESGSDMLVMGAYGHSRFREALLGGATRDMLENSEVPVLMAH